jgi:hypothetical protein
MLLDRTPSDTSTEPPPSSSAESAESSVNGEDVARLRLVCLVRSGDGYVIRAAGRLTDGDHRTHVDIQFGGGRGRAVELESAVRHIQRWCDEGVTVALATSGSTLTLRSADGTAVRLPRG